MPTHLIKTAYNFCNVLSGDATANAFLWGDKGGLNARFASGLESRAHSLVCAYDSTDELLVRARLLAIRLNNKVFI